MKKIGQISIIGIGLIGGSIALAVKRKAADVKIVGFDKDPLSVNKALEIGVIDISAPNLKEAVANSDIVFIAVPVSNILPIVREIMSFVDNETIITDVGSAKGSIIEGLKSSGFNISNFVGGHPMTGSELTGVEAATADLFTNCYYILTPTKETNASHFNRLHSFLNLLGARVIALDYEKHDEIMSYISHLPHAIASSLANTIGSMAYNDENFNILTAGGFRDMTRIASSNPDIWVDIFMANPVMVNKALETFIDSLLELKNAISNNNEEGLRKFLTSAQQAKSRMQGAAGVEERERILLKVIIPDKPGSISEVTVAIGAKGINIEDMQMVHLKEGVAILECAIAGEDKALEAAREIKRLGLKAQIVKGSVE